MTIQELKSIDITNKNVVIHGCAGAGKSYIADAITPASLGLASYHTDDFVTEYGHEQSIYAIIDSIEANPGMFYILEGTQASRFLRKLKELGKPEPDIIINVQRPEFEIYKTYQTERDPKKFSRAMAAFKGQEKIYNSYLDSLTEEQLENKIPYIVDFINNF